MAFQDFGCSSANDNVADWQKCEVPECPLSRRCWGVSGRDADIV